MIQAPKFLFLSINEVCNLRCRHCEYWRTPEPSLEMLGLPRMTEIIEEFAEMSPSGTVVICGGEPLLDARTYFEICRVSRGLGLTTLSVINGTLISTLAAAARVIVDGPDEISISVDGHTPEIHDRLRGVKGSFGRATSAVIALQRARYLSSNLWNHRKPTKINVMGLLGASTCGNLEKLYELALGDLGADKLKLNAVQPSFVNTRLHPEVTVDKNFVVESQVDPDKLRVSLEACDQKWKLDLNPTWISQVVEYFRLLWQKPARELELGWARNFQLQGHFCNSADRNIMVDVLGKASLCFSSQFPGTKLSRRGDLQTFWYNTKARASMHTCNALCSISHSVRRESATTRKDP